MMDDKPKNHSPRWLIYAVALLSGLALGLTLVFIAWNSALDENKREFSFESSKIREFIAHNIQVSNNVINTVASLITEGSILTISSLSVFLKYGSMSLSRTVKYFVPLPIPISSNDSS